MSGFQFPPPPPPPPRTSNPDNSQSDRFGESGRGRGRGRGRGGPDSRGHGGRGRGDQASTRGQYLGSNSRSSPPNSTILSNTHPPNNSSVGPRSYSLPQHGSYPKSALPPGSYVNPAFHRNAFETNTNQAAVDEHGTQTSPQRSVAGHKRKLEALRGPTQGRQAGPPTAPLIPSFGNPILAAANTTLPTKSPARRSKGGPNLLGLTPQGDQPQYSSDSDEDAVDEEAMYAELGTNLTFEHNGTVMTLNTAADLAAWKQERSKNFPTKLRLAAKVEEKRHIGEERKRLLTEASQALRAAKDAKHAKPQAKDFGFVEPQVSSRPETKLEKARRELEVQTARLDQLRKKVAKSEDKAAHAHDQASADKDTGSDAPESLPPDSDEPVKDQTESEANGGQDLELSIAEIATPYQRNKTDSAFEERVSKSAEADDASIVASQASPVPSTQNDEHASDDDDGQPEQTTSSRQVIDNKKTKRVCRYFAASGSCRDGDMCMFTHELDPRAAASLAQDQQQRDNRRTRHNADEQDETSPSSKRKTIYDRLLEQEQGQEDKLALQVIRYLGQVGLFARNEDDTS